MVSTAPATPVPAASAPADDGSPEPPTAIAGLNVPRLDPGERRVLLVMIDGLPTGLFERTLAAGELPRLATLFAKRPTLQLTALSTFPSSTSPSVPELLSGRYCALDNPEPGAVHAFDREERRVVRYVTEPDAWHWPAPNIFDAARSAGLPAVTVFEGRWDGPKAILTRAANFRDAALEVVGIVDYDGDGVPVDKLIREIRGPQPPRVSLLVFNAVDLAAHFHGPDSPEAREALIRTDALLGQVLDALATTPASRPVLAAEERSSYAAALAATPPSRSLLADTTLVLFGDHGMVQSGTHLDLQPYFQQRGLVTFDASSASQIVVRERLGRKWTEWPDVLLVSGGSNITQVYFRSPGGAWADGQPPVNRETERAALRPDPAVVGQELAEQTGISQVLRPLGPGEIEVLASGGRRGVVRAWPVGMEGEAPALTGGGYAYFVAADATADPFDYLADPALAALVCREGAAAQSCYLSREEWIRRTLSARFPAAVGLLGKAFDPPRFAGDLMLTALPGYSFLRGQNGDHGNFEREAMLTPLVLNGPGVDVAREPGLVRLVDIYPTAAVLLGASPADPALTGLDGKSLVPSTSELAAR